MRPGRAKIVARDKRSEMLARARPETPAGSPWLSSGHNLFLALSLGAAWVALEWMRGWVITGFGWNGLGTAFTRDVATNSDRGIYRSRRRHVPRGIFATSF